MKIEEVLKKENVGKLYSDGQYTFEVASILTDLGETAYDLVRTSDDLLVSDIYHTSKILSMDLTIELIDWDNVPIDTKVLVSMNGEEWLRRYFAKCINGRVYVWDYGATSFSSNHYTEWAYVKLYKDEEEEDYWE